MLLRRISEHVRDQNWFAVLLDLLIVILGIYLGLQASAWHESRKEQQRESEILERLRTDFETIGAEVDEALEYHWEIIDGMNAVLAASETGQVAEEDRERFIYGLDRALKYSAGARSSSTYVDILSSGQTFLIQDAELRSALSEYDELHQKSNIMFLQFWQAQRNHEIAFSRHFDLEGVRQRYGVVYIPGAVESFDIEAMAEDPDFRLAAQRLADYQAYFQIRHLQMQDAASSVCSLLDTALGESGESLESAEQDHTDNERRATCARPSDDPQDQPRQ